MGMWVNSDWLNGNVGGFQPRYYRIEIHHSKCQVSQACRLWMGGPHPWCGEGEQYQLDGSDPQIRPP